MEKRKIIFSLIYKFVERLSVKGLGLIISIVLARLLAPDDFGQIAILTVFINLSQIIIQGGLNTALVQSKTIDDRDYSTVFYISEAVSLILMFVLYISAPWISNYYGGNNLIWPLRIYAFTLLFGAFNSVQFAKLQREMRFKATMYTSLIATIFSGVIGISLAYLGYGIWALVIYNFSSIIASCITMLFVTKWFPRLTFSLKRAKVLFSFGWKMLISAILCSLYMDIRSLIIGKKFSTEDLAYYNRGQQFPNVISMTLDTSIQSVMFPALASCQDKIEQVKAMLRRSMTLGALLIMPVMAGLAITSESIVKILLTDKWLPSVFFMQIICLSEASVPLISSNLIAIKSIGRSDIYMKLEFARRCAMLLVLLISIFCFNSVEAIVVAYFISSWLDYVIIAIPMKKLFDYGLGEQFKDVWKIFLATILMGVITYMISLFEFNMVIELILQIIIGGFSYIILCSFLKIESFIYLKSTLFKFLRR